MNKQSEQALEDNLVKQLISLGHSFVTIKDETDLLANLKAQLEKHNNIKLSENEFKQVLIKLNSGNVFDKAHILRDKLLIKSDSDEAIYLELLNQEHWCKNEFQVTNQVTIEGSYKNRYDVTLLVNGLPLVQIELKRRGLELKEAFNQINRYQKHSFWSAHGLFQYVQLFVISNGVNTKYFSNNKFESFKQTFFWANEQNQLITQLDPFANSFLEPCHLAKMITKYIVLHESDKVLMVLRPYQYYAVEAIVDRVKTSKKFGYIWHTTGSGKTLTSFKAAQILMELPKVHKIVFVVDRKDLDAQTSKEFNHFSDGSVDGTDNTRKLVDQLCDDTKLLVTTIQKLNNAIEKKHYLKQIEHLQDKRIVFIFDECHRSQFGKTHGTIKEFFQKSQMFGFTGTPIFEQNCSTNEFGKRTTAMLFEECLHKYVITDAIGDGNVLKFSIEYVGRYKQKDGANEIDIEVEDIDTKELMESENRLNKITDYIIAHHDRKTHNRKFTAIFCVSSVDMLIHYYEIFKQKKQAAIHDLKIATIFSYQANEDDKDANGYIPDVEISVAADPQAEYLSAERADGKNKHTRDKLEEFISDYNQMFGCKYTTKDSKLFYQYYENIAKRVKRQEVDILLVVNMFLTGFDSKTLNTIYVDKNLKYHGLIQAFSRTNRILNETKSQGNVLCFRNLKKATDDAIELFSNKDAKEIILIKPYEEYLSIFAEALANMQNMAPTVDSVNDLQTDQQRLEFIKAFRELLRIKNVLGAFANFTFNDLPLAEQEFEDYKSKYVDLYQEIKNDRQKEKVSILNDVDFELELIHRDEINVAYILRLLSQMKDTNEEKQKEQRKQINNIIGGDPRLRSKKELIEKFIEETLPHLVDGDEVNEAFVKFVNDEQRVAFKDLCESEGLDVAKFEQTVAKYLYDGINPLNDDIANALLEKPKLLERRKLIPRILDKMMEYVNTYISGMD